MNYFMQDMRERHGPLWNHVSNEELAWMLAAAFSVGLLLGITITLMGGGAQ